jgi:two-component sensor histidine kinase
MLLPLDIRTVFLFLVSVSLLGAFVLALDARKGATLFDGAFIAGLALQAAAWTLISMRGLASDLLTFSIGNSLQFAGTALIGLGLASAKARITRGWALGYAAALALTLIAWWLPGLDKKTHIVLISAVYPFFLGVPGALIARESRGRSAMELFLGIILILYSAGMLFRGVSLFLGGKYDLFSHGILQVLVIFVFAIVMNLVTLGYILMKKEKANERLKELSEARKVLLTELRHRIKNSLAIISSLASLESEQRGDEVLRAAMRKMRDRIRAVAELYDLLIAESPEGGVYVDAYIGELVEHLRDGYSPEFGPVRIELGIERVQVDAKTTVSLGLIVNELATNAIKYAFPGGRPGTIRIGFARWEEEDELTVVDDGIGIDGEPSGLGSLVVATLARQLDGSVSYSREGGTRVEVRFRRRGP